LSSYVYVLSYDHTAELKLNVFFLSIDYSFSRGSKSRN